MISFVSSDINSDDQESFHSFWTRQIRIGTTDLILALNTCCTRHWFRDMLLYTFGWLCYTLTKWGLHYATYQYLHFAVTTIVNYYSPIKKMFGNKIGSFAVLFVSTTGIILRRTLLFFYHNPKDSKNGNDNKNRKSTKHSNLTQ